MRCGDYSDWSDVNIIINTISIVVAIICSSGGIWDGIILVYARVIDKVSIVDCSIVFDIGILCVGRSCIHSCYSLSFDNREKVFIY